jgi:hypothetical protein
MPTPSSTLPVPDPSHSADYLGPPPLNPGDDPAGYATLLTRLVAEVGPRGVIEEACVRDIAEMMWEAARLRRLKAKLMTISAGDGLRDVLDAIGVPYDVRRDLVPRWAARELTAVGEADALLTAAGLDMHHVMAKTLARRIDQIERIDRMAAGAEARRAAMLREIALYREASFAARLRGAVEAAETIAEGEFTEVAAGSAAALTAVEAAE